MENLRQCYIPSGEGSGAHCVAKGQCVNLIVEQSGAMVSTAVVVMVMFTVLTLTSWRRICHFKRSVSMQWL